MRRCLCYIAAVTLLAAGYSGCSSLNPFHREAPERYSSEGRKLLEEAAGMLRYSYGYDSELEIHYIVSTPLSEKNLKSKSSAMLSILRKYKTGDVVDFYGAVFSLKLDTQALMEVMKEDEEWTDYTYIQKYLYPPIAEFESFLESVISSMGSDAASLVKAKKETVQSSRVKK